MQKNKRKHTTQVCFVHATHTTLSTSTENLSSVEEEGG